MVTIADDFNRANSTALGSSWVETQGDAQILSNALNALTAGATVRAIHTTPLSSDNHEATCVINASPTPPTSGFTAGLQAGPIVRRTEGGGSYSAVLRLSTVTGTEWSVVIRRRIGTTNTELVVTPIAAPTMPATLTLRAQGATFTASLNGSTVATVEDSTYLTGKQAGVDLLAQSSTRHLSVTDFQAVDLPGTSNRRVKINGAMVYVSRRAKVG